MNHRVPAIYEKGHLRLLEPLDLPEHTQLTVTISVPEDRQQAASTRRYSPCPTRALSLLLLEPLIGTMPAGGDALRDSEALYDEDW